MREFDLIRQIQRQTAVGAAKDAELGVMLGIGDDAAVLEIPQGFHLVAAADMLNGGVHFPEATSPFDIGFKSLAVNLSDLAAMGAIPRWALLSLSMPKDDPAWLEGFISGFKSLACNHEVALVGGDTTGGPLCVSLTVLGLVEAGRQLTRSGAGPGDLVVVSGTVGAAARELELLKQGEPAGERQFLDRPQPRLGLGRVLQGRASACIDVSDGLLADLGHILDASGCGAQIELGNLPAAGLLSGLAEKERWGYQLSGGDDYELLFTLPPRFRASLDLWREDLGIRLSIIGQVLEGDSLTCIDPGGKEFQPQDTGFDHFGKAK